MCEHFPYTLYPTVVTYCILHSFLICLNLVSVCNSSYFFYGFSSRKVHMKVHMYMKVHMKEVLACEVRFSYELKK